jgi:hypothetical protein
MISIDWLTSWFEANRAILAAHEIEYSILVRNSNTDNPAQAHDIDSKRYVARVTLWKAAIVILRHSKLAKTALV